MEFEEQFGDITDAPLEALARHGLLDALKRAVRSGLGC